MIIVALAICISPGLALAGGVEVTSSNLIDNASDYDGQEVAYTGEVIGNVLARGNYSWINVYDGSNALGVWVKSSDIKDINMLGSYTAHGDTVKVTGVFHEACAEHGGDMDIHAESITIIQQGYAVSHGVPIWKLILGPVVLAGAAVCILMAFKNKQLDFKKSK